jgi:mannose-6-phosphate isomerase-like protein (cupin superfamily)
MSMEKERSGFVPGLGAGVVLGVVMGLLAVWSATGGGTGTLAANIQAAQGNTSKVVLENARVRVKDAMFMPGIAKPGMHTHDLPHVGVVIQGGTLVFRYPDGKSETLDLPTGGVGYRDANVTHEPINPGKTPVRVIEVELK